MPELLWDVLPSEPTDLAKHNDRVVEVSSHSGTLADETVYFNVHTQVFYRRQESFVAAARWSIGRIKY